MSRVILLNGAPGTGKSTIAEAWMNADPTSRAVVEVDLIKHSLPTWPDDPHTAGLRARELAAMAVVATLDEGHDVMLPQFLARPDFADMLAQVAALSDAESVEVLLTLSADALSERQSVRQANPERPEHAENDKGVRPDEAAETLASLSSWADARPGHVLRVDASGTAAEVLTRLEAALGDQ